MGVRLIEGSQDDLPRKFDANVCRPADEMMCLEGNLNFALIRAVKQRLFYASA